MAAKDRELELAKNDIRAEMRSAGDDEDTGVIEQEALSRAPKGASSIPPRGKLLLAILDRLSPVGRVIILGLTLLIVGGLVYVSGAAGAIVGAFK